MPATGTTHKGCYIVVSFPVNLYGWVSMQKCSVDSDRIVFLLLMYCLYLVVCF